MSHDNEHLGSGAHRASLPDSSEPDQLEPEALRASLRRLATGERPRGRARFIVELGHQRALIKRLAPEQLRDRAFVLTRPLDGLRLRQQTQIFACEGELYELVILDPSLRPANPEELEPLFVLYDQAARICMLEPLTDLDALLEGPHINKDLDRGDGHPAGPATSLAGVLAEIEPILAPLRPASDAGLRRGLVHGDLHRDNLLVPVTGEGPALLIDLDPIFHSYAALNLAHVCIAEYVTSTSTSRVAELPAARALLMARLDLADTQAFDYLVLVELFRMLVKRGFHRDHYNEDWEHELLFLFEGYGVDTYLATVRAASSR